MTELMLHSDGPTRFAQTMARRGVPYVPIAYSHKALDRLAPVADIDGTRRGDGVLDPLFFEAWLTSHTDVILSNGGRLMFDWEDPRVTPEQYAAAVELADVVLDGQIKEYGAYASSSVPYWQAPLGEEPTTRNVGWNRLNDDQRAAAIQHHVARGVSMSEPLDVVCCTCYDPYRDFGDVVRGDDAPDQVGEYRQSEEMYAWLDAQIETVCRVSDVRDRPFYAFVAHRVYRGPTTDAELSDDEFADTVRTILTNQWWRERRDRARLLLWSADIYHHGRGRIPGTLLDVERSLRRKWHVMSRVAAEVEAESVARDATSRALAGDRNVEGESE